MSEEDKGSRKPSSPWPSARKSEAAAATAKDPAPAAPAEGLEKKAWGAPFDKLDRAWSKLDARLCAFVLLADIVTLVFWISLKALSSTGKAGPGFIFRVMFASVVVGGVAHVLTRKRVREHEL